MTEVEREYIALTCVAAACADGHLDRQERQRIERMVEELGYGGRDLFREAFAKPVDAAILADRIRSDAARRTAYQMAAQVCLADGVLSEGEEKFLADLEQAFGLSEAAARGIRTEAALYTDPGLPPAATPPSERADAADLDQRILRYAMLAGAAELLPQAAATVVVVPLQLKLVYEVGQRHGVQLDRNQILDLIGAFGIGATSQMVEGMARRLMKGVGGSLLGGLFGGVAGAATGVLVSFTTTYALGHAAEVYYRQGRKLETGDLKALFERFQGEARTIYPRVEAEIRAQAESLDAQSLLRKVKDLA